jgi:hypothetical protein
MQIDGHNTATYVAARLAGFSFQEAEKIAYAAQYVDDATNAGLVIFEGSPFMYSRIASAHKMIDYANLVNVENHLAWMPFHFLPGNGGMGADATNDLTALERLICRPDSVVARDMLRYAFQDRELPRALHRLGIAMHVYADTFAHQGFVGALSEANRATDVTCGDSKRDAAIQRETKKELIDAALARIKAVGQFAVRAVTIMWREKTWPGDFIRSFMHRAPVGHAATDVYPDQPYLLWRYKDYKGVHVERDNPAVFLLAMDKMVRVMQAWRAGDAQMNLEMQPGMNARDRREAERLFRTLTDIGGEARRTGWVTAIESRVFSFGDEVPSYVGKGAGSWKEAALGTERETDTGVERFPFTRDFLYSDWKLFHDAIQAHRSDVIHEILPRYGICAA